MEKRAISSTLQNQWFTKPSLILIAHPWARQAVFNRL